VAGPVRAVWSGATDGDLRPSGRPPGRGAEDLERWAAGVTAAGPAGRVRRVHWLDQVHGSRVVAVGPPSAGAVTAEVTAVDAGSGDALVSGAPSTGLCVLTADCAAVALGSDEGVFAAVHAGWRGLVGGVVGAAVDAMRAMGATRVVGALGPCVHASCYAFSPDDLDRVAGRLGDTVRGRTGDGRPALDIPAAVSVALSSAGADQTVGVDRCTACAGGYFSHRARGDRGRQALLVWSVAPPATG